MGPNPLGGAGHWKWQQWRHGLGCYGTCFGGARGLRHRMPLPQHASQGGVAVRSLASVALPTFVQGMATTYDHNGLHYVTKVATKNLDK